MATRIEDEETVQLLEEYAEHLHTTTNDALRDLLRRELNRLKQPSAEERYQAALAYVATAPTSGPVTKADIDALYDYLPPRI